MKIQAFTDEYLQSLCETALHLIRSGVSCLPIRGDLDPVNPKAPAISAWKELEGRLPTESEIKHWFLECGYGGLAIVLGKTSNKVCLEFDDSAYIEPFTLECPHLTHTYTELSAGRRLPHYFFSPPPGHELRKRGIAGRIELLGHGQYVIIAPTTIAGRTYTRAGGGTYQQLTSETWQQLIDFIERYAPTPNKTPYEIQSALSPKMANHNLLVAIFHKSIVEEGGRNNALFRTGLFAHNTGYTAQEAKSALIPAYIDAAPPPGHRRETNASRRNEGLRTIDSAFTYPIRASVPNHVRERLLQTKRGQAARLLDMLFMAHRPGEKVLLRDALSIAKFYGMGRPTTLQAFSELDKISTELSQNDINTSPKTGVKGIQNREKGILVQNCTVNTYGIPPNASVIMVQNCTKNKRGRPAHTGKAVFLPQIEALCQFLQVENKGGDCIRPEGLKSLRAYCDELERRTLARVTTTAWRTAKRQGTNRSTAQRRLDRIQAGRIVQEPKRTVIAPDNIDLLPEFASDNLFTKYRERGMYLEVDTGSATFKRRPTAENARQAWQAGYAASLCKPEPIIRTTPPAQIIQDTIPQTEPMAMAVGAEDRPAPVVTTETVFTTDPLLSEAHMLGAKITPIASRRVKEPVLVGQGVDTT